MASSINKSSAELILNARKFNHSFPIFKLKEFIKKSNCTKSSKFLIIGLAFKSFPSTNDTRGSLSINVINYLLQNGIQEKNIVCYDPLVNNLPGFSNLSIENTFSSINNYQFSHIVICNMSESTQSAFTNLLIPSLNRDTCSILSFIHMKSSILPNTSDLFV